MQWTKPGKIACVFFFCSCQCNNRSESHSVYISCVLILRVSISLAMYRDMNEGRDEGGKVRIEYSL